MPTTIPIESRTNTCEQVALFREEVSDTDMATLRSHLLTHGWQTRRQLSEALGWSERKIRDVAELCGAEVVRCQQGFKLFDQLTREELGAAQQAADAALSQSNKQRAYALALLHKLHARVG
jgi:hypothetical protein